MASIIVPSRRIWTRQPPSGVGVDLELASRLKLEGLWSNHNGALLRSEYNAKYPVTLGGTAPTLSLSPLGRSALLPSTGDNAPYVASFPYYANFTAFIVFQLGATTSNSPYKGLLAHASTTGVSGDWYLYVKTTDNKLHVDIPWVAGDVHIGSQTLAVGGLYCVALVRSGTTGSWTHKTFINGTLDNSSTTASNPTTTAFHFGVGGMPFLFGGTTDHAVAHYGICSGALPDAAVERLTANPWQLFAPANSPVFYSLPSGGTTNYPITLDTGAFTLTGNALGLTVQRAISAATGSFTLTGNALGLTVQRYIAAGTGAFTLTGNTVGLTAQRKITLGTGAFTLTGNDVTFDYSGGNNYPITFETGGFNLTGNAAALTAARLLSAGTGAFTFTGNAVTFAKTNSITLGTGQFNLTGNAVEFDYSGTVPVTTTGGGVSAKNKKKLKKRKTENKKDDTLESLIESLKAEKEAPKKVVEQVKEVVKLVQKVESFKEREQDDDDEQEVEIEVKSPDKPLDTSAMMLYIATLISKTNTAIEAIGRLESKLGRMEADIKAVKKAAQNAEELTAMMLANED